MRFWNCGDEREGYDDCECQQQRDSESLLEWIHGGGGAWQAGSGLNGDVFRKHSCEVRLRLWMRRSDASDTCDRFTCIAVSFTDGLTDVEGTLR